MIGAQEVFAVGLVEKDTLDVDRHTQASKLPGGHRCCDVMVFAAAKVSMETY